MLLRSSSTPILGTLLSSSSSPFFSESPNNNPLEKTYSDNLKKLSFSHGHGITHHHHHHPNITSSHPFSCHFSPLPTPSEQDSLSTASNGGGGGFRKARSDGNLQDLLTDHHDDLRCLNHSPPTRTCSRSSSSILETIPSFSFYNSKEDDLEEVREEEREEKDELERSVTIGESIAGEFCLSGEKEKAAAEQVGTSPLFLARGLGIDVAGPGSSLIDRFEGGAGAESGDGGGGGGYPIAVDNAGEQSDMETYYRKMVEENPSSALFLRNYAQFLYQSKGDPGRAEEYYSRAILAEPGDGEVLSQYAKLTWDLHRDHERASNYFEHSIRAAPQDSQVLAAYAGFLWETEEDEHGKEGGGGGEAGQSLQEYNGGTKVSYNGVVVASASV